MFHVAFHDISWHRLVPRIPSFPAFQVPQVRLSGGQREGALALAVDRFLGSDLPCCHDGEGNGQQRRGMAGRAGLDGIAQGRASSVAFKAADGLKGSKLQIDQQIWETICHVIIYSYCFSYVL